ncbi:hypothetical protein B0H19DRAFT_1085417 [Mycena capillaripes]|nr:hypothetical protein B0H19DRAFT_1085417 [Mycena capillaripes]
MTVNLWSPSSSCGSELQCAERSSNCSCTLRSYAIFKLMEVCEFIVAMRSRADDDDVEFYESLESDCTRDIGDGVDHIAVTYVHHKGQEDQRAVCKTRLGDDANGFAKLALVDAYGRGKRGVSGSKLFILVLDTPYPPHKESYNTKVSAVDV